jgi:hypothetical protein
VTRIREPVTVVSLILANIAAGFVAWRFSWYVWAEDACLDAGGAFRDGVCRLESESYLMDPTPRSLAAWLITVVVAIVPALAVFAVARGILVGLGATSARS